MRSLRRRSRYSLLFKLEITQRLSWSTVFPTQIDVPFYLSAGWLGKIPPPRPITG
ncbi:MAG: hypothetical protein KME14_16740 [Tildeniella torsiva UHER 1998/13D]|nr:hypothetical protein [Tildeniella torsiva UHER 1998/13D]